MRESERPNDHEKFKELAALAQAHGLTLSEKIELKRHLQCCEPCRAISGEYSLLSSEGMAFLEADFGHVSEAEAWDRRAVRDELSSRLRESEVSAAVLAVQPRAASVSLTWNSSPRWIAAAAACLLVAVGVGAYHLGNRRQVVPASTLTSNAPQVSPAPARLQE